VCIKREIPYLNDMIKLKRANRIGTVEEYYFSKKLKELEVLKSNGIEIINLGIGNPDLKPPEDALKVLEHGIMNGENGYQSYTGINELKISMLNWYQSIYGVSLNQSQILPLIGSKEAIFHLSMAFLEKGDEVLIPNPSYPAYLSNCKIAEATPLFYDLDMENGWLPNFEEIEKKDLSKVKLMWCNYPNMPTGAKATRQLFERFIAFAKAHNILIVHDNPYSLILNNEPISIMEVEEAINYAVELNSLSKSHNIAGWRVGMMIANEEILKNVLKIKTNLDSGSYKGLQLAAAEAMKVDKNWYVKQNKVYEVRKEKAIEMNRLLNCSFTEDFNGLFLWAKIPEEYKDARTFSDYILDKTGIFITPGFIFGSNGEKYIRTSLCLPAAVFDRAIQKIKKYL